MNESANQQCILGNVLGTWVLATNYKALLHEVHLRVRDKSTFAVEFANTHVIVLIRHSFERRGDVWNKFDYIVPDGMPLVWVLRARGIKIKDRVYGPHFARLCFEQSPAPYTHYLYGGSTECLKKLQTKLKEIQPNIQIVGSRDAYSYPESQDEVVEEINRLSPDFIWVAIATPRQQQFIADNKDKIKRGVLFSVGFAFDAIAGIRDDAPIWMQKYGLTWLFRLSRDPRRLGPRYLKYNTLFLFYLLWDWIKSFLRFKR